MSTTTEIDVHAGDSHLLAEKGIHTIREAYDRHRMLATSENADVYLIRSHVAYHCGANAAARCTIRASRGHSYRVKNVHGIDYIVRIADHFDHRDGVIGMM